MKVNRLNLLTALVSFAASGVWLATGQSATGLVWLICSVAWLTLAIAGFRASTDEPHPLRRLARRLSRMLIWS
jgi:hypothetical protein